jgi:hypothetical protein
VSNKQFKRSLVRVNSHAVKEPYFLCHGAAQLVGAFGITIRIKAGRDGFIERAGKLGVERHFILALDEVAARRYQSRDLTYIRLSPLIYRLQFLLLLPWRNMEVSAPEITEDGKFRRLGLSSNPQRQARAGGDYEFFVAISNKTCLDNH